MRRATGNSNGFHRRLAKELQRFFSKPFCAFVVSGSHLRQVVRLEMALRQVGARIELIERRQRFGRSFGCSGEGIDELAGFFVPESDVERAKADIGRQAVAADQTECRPIPRGRARIMIAVETIAFAADLNDRAIAQPKRVNIHDGGRYAWRTVAVEQNRPAKCRVVSLCSAHSPGNDSAVKSREALCHRLRNKVPSSPFYPFAVGAICYNNDARQRAF